MDSFFLFFVFFGLVFFRVYEFFLRHNNNDFRHAFFRVKGGEEILRVGPLLNYDSKEKYHKF